MTRFDEENVPDDLESRKVRRKKILIEISLKIYIDISKKIFVITDFDVLCPTKNISGKAKPRKLKFGGQIDRGTGKYFGSEIHSRFCLG